MMDRTCHTCKVVMTIGTCTVWAGSATQASQRLEETKLLMCLMGMERRGPRGQMKASRSALKMLPSIAKMRKKRPAFLGVDWPDGGVPTFKRKFWEALVTDLYTLNGSFMVHCMAGHGRTGTALAILASLSGVCGTADPVLWVRERYCSHVVETRAQINYLRSLGIQTEAVPSYEIAGRGTGSGGGHASWKGQESVITVSDGDYQRDWVTRIR